MPAAFKLKSFGDKIIKDFEKSEFNNRKRASTYLRDKIKDRIKSKNISTPGQPPGRFSGNLLKGIKKRDLNDRSLVGAVAPAFHSLLLEFGTRTMQKRPFLWSTFNEERENIIEILSDPWT